MSDTQNYKILTLKSDEFIALRLAMELRLSYLESAILRNEGTPEAGYFVHALKSTKSIIVKLAAA